LGECSWCKSRTRSGLGGSLSLLLKALKEFEPRSPKDFGVFLWVFENQIFLIGR